MDINFWLELLVVVLAIGIGAKWGGLGLGAGGGFGLMVLIFIFGMTPGSPPVSVLFIMLAVVSCASILQGSGIRTVRFLGGGPLYPGEVRGHMVPGVGQISL